MNHNVLFAFGVTLLAGLSTGIGSLMALFAKRTNTKFLSLSLGFSAGVMLYVAMIEIFKKSKDCLTGVYGEGTGYWLTILSFFAGIILIALIDFFIPSTESDIGATDKNPPNTQLNRMGFITALTIAIHNFPEGMTTFTSALKDPGSALQLQSRSRSIIFRKELQPHCPFIFQAEIKKRRSAFLFFRA